MTANQTASLKKTVAFDKTSNILYRRKTLVADGVGIFCPTAAISASGAIIHDADGNKLIDFGGGIGVLNAGHCPPRVVDAIKAQAEKLIHTCFHVSTTNIYLDVCERLIELFPHGEATKVMLTNTGAE